MAGENKRTDELAKSANPRRGLQVIFDPVTDITEQSSVKETEGGKVPANIDWNSNTTYTNEAGAGGDPLLYIVRFGDLFYESLTVGNQGNTPNQGVNWNILTVSDADGITLTPYEPDLYTIIGSIVTDDVGAIYKLDADVPFKSTDLTTEIGLGDWISAPLAAQALYDFIPQGSDPAYSEARLYALTDGTLNYFDNITGTSLQIGREQILDIHNGNGVTLTNFTAVKYDTAVSGVPSVSRAIADSVDNADGVAVCTHDILVGEVGKATLTGLATGDTSLWSVDDILFVSTTLPGTLTNLEQQILSPVARVLVSDGVNGIIAIDPRGVKNITAIGQAFGLNNVQSLTTTPTELIVYNNTDTLDTLNVTVTQTGADPYTASMSPISMGASGFYRAHFSTSIVGTANAIHTFEIYLDGIPTGIISNIDLTNNNINSGNCSFSPITSEIIDDTQVLSIYGYLDTGTSSVTFETVTFNIERIGNV